MKHHIIVLLFLGFLECLNAQNLESEMLFPGTLRSTNDSVYFTSPQWKQPERLSFFKNDSIDWGTYGYKGVYFKVWTDLDTVVIPHVNHPYQQFIRIPLTSERDTSEMILRFQPTENSHFTNNYVSKNRGTISIDIPELYELANIILFLSDCSGKTNNRPNSEYTNRVRQYFEPVKNHTLIKILNKECSNSPWGTYYGFRENSICFSFIEDYLEYNTPYKHVYWDDSNIKGGQFRNMLYLIQDFVKESNFRLFYKNNQEYYNSLINRQKELLPLRQMWNWIENEFPQKMDSYKVVFSPLIEGSHSTQKFIKGYFGYPEFQECIMFINSAEHLDNNSAYSDKLREGLMSGIVFTEIDHNYVNPTSDENIDLIRELMKDKDFWATKNAQQNYPSEYSIFNEYMTHSIFCLYALENYEGKIAKEIVDKRIQLMERRGYPKFSQFNTRLTNMMLNSPRTIYEAYGEIIDELKNIK